MDKWQSVSDCDEYDERVCVCVCVCVCVNLYVIIWKGASKEPYHMLLIGEL